jgi:NAD(P)-dependent dehydrogenase (short-subunit alcohol dehydrogenase family)
VPRRRRKVSGGLRHRLKALASEKRGERVQQLSPMKRLAEVGEVADLLLYLESPEFLNGEVVHLDGGTHAGKW